MRKLGIVALAAAALFAQGVRAEDAKDKMNKAGQETSGAARMEGQRAREAADRAVNGRGPASEQKAEEAKSPMNGDAHDRTAQNAKAEKKHPLFDGKHNFDVDGKVQHASKDSLTISREDLPPATLSVSHGTKVELDGNQVSADQLKPGEDVKASFNLNKDKAEAVEIKAKRSDENKK
jgi:hypothetical protein